MNFKKYCGWHRCRATVLHSYPDSYCHDLIIALVKSTCERGETSANLGANFYLARRIGRTLEEMEMVSLCFLMLLLWFAINSHHRLQAAALSLISSRPGSFYKLLTHPQHRAFASRTVGQAREQAVINRSQATANERVRWEIDTPQVNSKHCSVAGNARSPLTIIRTILDADRMLAFHS